MGVLLNARTASRMCEFRILGNNRLRTRYSATNIRTTKGKVMKLAKTDQVASGAKKNSTVETSIIAAKNRVHATVTWRA